jgi:hypothetical protein
VIADNTSRHQFDQARGTFDIRSGQGVTNRIVQLAVPLVPRARSPVYDAYSLG